MKIVATVEYDGDTYWIRFPGIEKAGSYAEGPEDIVPHARNFLNDWVQPGSSRPASLDDALTEDAVTPFEGTRLVVFDWDPPP